MPLQAHRGGTSLNGIGSELLETFFQVTFLLQSVISTGNTQNGQQLFRTNKVQMSLGLLLADTLRGGMNGEHTVYSTHKLKRPTNQHGRDKKKLQLSHRMELTTRGRTTPRAHLRLT